jgi:hypothetical protein
MARTSSLVEYNSYDLIKEVQISFFAPLQTIQSADFAIIFRVALSTVCGRAMG